MKTLCISTGEQYQSGFALTGIIALLSMLFYIRFHAEKESPQVRTPAQDLIALPCFPNALKTSLPYGNKHSYKRIQHCSQNVNHQQWKM